jgi:hypothetical protein
VTVLVASCGRGFVQGSRWSLEWVDFGGDVELFWFGTRAGCGSGFGLGLVMVMVMVMVMGVCWIWRGHWVWWGTASGQWATVVSWWWMVGWYVLLVRLGKGDNNWFSSMLSGELEIFGWKDDGSSVFFLEINKWRSFD